ncbi:MAG: alpha/beta fold hydrolase [Anaerolineae bacterium]|nr:alpha/beta fold hydrolase [Anaerolineae bacterium]
MRRLIVLFLLILIATSWWQVLAAREGLAVRELQRDGTPLTYIAPEGGRRLPAVVVGHGFAGSRQLMLAYGHVLAHAGYAVMLPDFSGHGANTQPLDRAALQRDLDAAYAALLDQPEVDLQRVALLGHSMGSGAVMAAGVRQTDRYRATVAISPTAADVNPTAPRNLLLQAGAWEGNFVENAQRLLAQAGGENTDVAGGRARRLIIVPNAEHISILFRDESHQAALGWLNQTFGLSTTSTYADRRILWYALHLAAWLALAALSVRWLGLAPAPAVGEVAIPQWRDRVQPLAERRRAIRKTPSLDQGVRREVAVAASARPWPAWLGLMLAPLAASLGLWLLNLVTDLASLGGLQVGGAVGVWFTLAGLVWLLLLAGRPPRLPAQWGALNGRDLLLGLALFGLLWVAFGALGQVVWLPWLLNPIRLLKWPFLALACLPWFLAAGVALRETGTLGRLAWWLGQSAALMVGFVLALGLVPSLGFIVLLLPLFPILTGLLFVAGAGLRRPWAFALGSALFFGWTLAAAFPLAM